MLRLVIRWMLTISAVHATLLAVAGALASGLPSAGEIAFVLEHDSSRGIFSIDVGRGIVVQLVARGANPVWSPDGKYLAFESLTNERDIYVMDANGHSLHNLTHHPALDTSPQWAPDSQHLAFLSDRQSPGLGEVYLTDFSGDNFVRYETADRLPAWSPDGSRMALVMARANNNIAADLVISNTAGNHELKRISLARKDLGLPEAIAWLPDGQHLEFWVRNNSDSTLFIFNAETGAIEHVISPLTFLDALPTFSPDGVMLFSIRAHTVYAVDLREGSLRDLTGDDTALNFAPAWSPDGQWIVFVSFRDRQQGLYLMAPDGSQLHALFTSRDQVMSPVWRPPP